MKMKNRPGEGSPMTLAIVLVLLMIFCAASEFLRIWLTAQGVQEAAQQVALSVVNDNYNEVYPAVREGYAAGCEPSGGDWLLTVDTGDVYGTLSQILGLEKSGERYVKFANGKTEYAISNLSVWVSNNALQSGKTDGYTATVEFDLEFPINFFGSISRTIRLRIHTAAEYIPKF